MTTALISCLLDSNTEGGRGGGEEKRTLSKPNDFCQTSYPSPRDPDAGS